MRLSAASKDRLARGFSALIMAAVLIHFGDRLLDVKIEVFSGGISYFSPFWVVDVFLLPFISGILVSVIYGMGGKWLCYFPPLIVRAISYYEVANVTGVPPGASLIPLGWWGFFVILVVEAAVIGGVLGEVLIKRTYGRQSTRAVYKTPPRTTDHPNTK